METRVKLQVTAIKRECIGKTVSGDLLDTIAGKAWTTATKAEYFSDNGMKRVTFCKRIMLQCSRESASIDRT